MLLFRPGTFCNYANISVWNINSKIHIKTSFWVLEQTCKIHHWSEQTTLFILSSASGCGFVVWLEEHVAIFTRVMMRMLISQGSALQAILLFFFFAYFNWKLRTSRNLPKILTFHNQTLWMVVGVVTGDNYMCKVYGSSFHIFSATRNILKTHTVTGVLQNMFD